MGVVIEHNKQLNKSMTYRLLVYCNASPNFAYTPISMNKALAAELMKLKPFRRSMQLERSFEKLLDDLPDNPVIKDIDVMFNPEYKVDVMKILVSAFKRKPFSLIWPGMCSGTKLTYSEEGLPDYKSFEIIEYDIVCVI